MKSFCKLRQQFLLVGGLLLLVELPVSSFASDILGCGGFVRSPYKLDFDKIEIKLFTKQGSLKLKTECAPTTGYFFIPLENKGDFILKISPPEGWTFDPPEYHVKFDGETDKCSKGEDVNFDFKGFSIYGKVVSSFSGGVPGGPSGVTLALSGPDNLKLTTTTGEGGSFSFDSIPPGPYSLKAAQASLTFEKDSYAFEISNKNVVVDSQLVVTGYHITGRVKSDGNPVEKVTIVLISADNAAKSPKGCNPGKSDDLSLPADVKGKILCVENSDKSGVFKFGPLSPGKYSVVPVYKGVNIVYNVNPDRLDVDLGHASMELTPAFEVEGFTVQGRVKGHSGASILVNGELRATSGHDGTFTIAKMKPGTYEFEVLAEKFQFDKKKISIQPTNPVIPDFVPSRFQTCGTIKILSKSGLPQLTLAFQKVGNQDQIIREKINDPNHSCVFLAEGSYVAWVESSPEKYFLPEKAPIQIPSGTGFTFKEFSGSISGSVTCKFASCDGVKIRAENRETGVLIQEKVLTGEKKFKFENLESGDYSLVVDGDQFCWKQESIDKVQLKNANVENVAFVQTGIPLEIRSSHGTLVKITGKTKAASRELNLETNVVEKICLTDPDSPPESYQITPTGCHSFEKNSYSLKLGSRLELIAKKHRHSWTIVAPSKVADLKITRNDESFTLEQIINKKSTGIQITEARVANNKGFSYEVSSLEEPGVTVEWQIFSYGFIFEPSSFSIDTLNDCQDNLLQVVAKQSHVIQGKFTPALEGVEVRIDWIGDPDSTTYVNSNAHGEYIAGPFVHPSGFKVTPELAGYTFKALENDAYSFTVYQLAKIQVKVETGKDAESVPSVLLSISGPNSYRQNKITDENGEMTFGDLQPGQYYMKALLKEFKFQPSSINIDLKEQETKKIVLKAIRESFSLIGQLSSLSGELMPNLLVSAKGIGNCSEYGEEGSSDEMGNFRIWALKSYCNYHISVVKKDEFVNRVERTIPDVLDVKIGTEDIHNVSFVVIRPVRRMDVSLRVHTNNEKSLDHLKAIVYSSRAQDVPLHIVPFNGISYIILPPIPKDGTEYVIAFDANLNKYQYNYKLPAEINFTADSAYAHFKLDFNIDPAPVDQEIGKNSYIAFAMVVMVVLMIANHERVGAWAKEIIENYSGSSAGTAAKKSKSKTK